MLVARWLIRARWPYLFLAASSLDACFPPKAYLRTPLEYPPSTPGMRWNLAGISFNVSLLILYKGYSPPGTWCPSPTNTRSAASPKNLNTLFFRRIPPNTTRIPSEYPGSELEFRVLKRCFGGQARHKERSKRTQACAQGARRHGPASPHFLSLPPSSSMSCCTRAGNSAPRASTSKL